MHWRFTHKDTYKSSRLISYISTPDHSEVEAPVELQKSIITLENGQKITKIETIEGDSHRTPIIVSHGFSVLPASMTGNMEAICKGSRIDGQPGRKVVAFDLHEGYTMNDNELGDTKHYSKAVDGWSKCLLQAMDASGIQNADLVGHSMGAAASLVAAYKQPERFNKVTMMKPAGFMGDEATQSKFVTEVFGDLKDRFKKQFENIALGKKHDLRSWNKYVLSWKDTLMYGIRSPRKTMAEAVGASRLKMDNLLKDMQSSPEYAHLKVDIVAGKKDAMFAVEKIQTHLKEAGIPDDNITVKDWRHSEMIDQPEEVAKIVNNNEKVQTLGEIVNRQQATTKNDIANLLSNPVPNQSRRTNPQEQYKSVA